jgi:hypothetical protein
VFCCACVLQFFFSLCSQAIPLKSSLMKLLGQFPSHLFLQVAETLGTDPAIVVLGDVSFFSRCEAAFF